MTVRDDALHSAAAPARAASAPMVTVWDPFVRVFHWSLVALFAIAFLTGDEIEDLHVAAGYGVAGLVALRILWGLIGPRYARFTDFVRPPSAVLRHLGDAVRMRAPRFLGHNPAGGAMVVALLLMLAGITTTGFMMTTDAYWGAEWVEETHEALVNVTLGLIALHVAGVLFAGFEHGENLVKAMVTGRKRAS